MNGRREPTPNATSGTSSPCNPSFPFRGRRNVLQGGLQALKTVDLDIQRGKLFALLGPNGAGETTLINAVCGIVTPTTGQITAAGYDTRKDYRAARSLIGLVPQEMHIDVFETVWAVTSYSRGLFGLPPNPAYIEQILKDLSLWEKKDEKLQALSGGMKRRVLIAKALAHEPEILFLDEPTAGVDVELRRDMWGLVRKMRDRGVTIILTTHYIEEAEEMADRVGVITKGELILVEEETLMKKLGKKQVNFELVEPLATLPDTLKEWDRALRRQGPPTRIYIRHDAADLPPRRRLPYPPHERAWACVFKDLETKQSSLEEHFRQPGACRRSLRTTADVRS